MQMATLSISSVIRPHLGLALLLVGVFLATMHSAKVLAEPITLIQHGFDEEDARLLMQKSDQPGSVAKEDDNEAARGGKPARRNKKPNLVVFLADDYGWANLGYHRDPKTPEVQTPNLDALIGQGVVFDRFYTFHMCSPSRCALQTGRYAQHVNQVNIDPESYNLNDPVGGYAGIPVPMTGIAEKLRAQGMRTVLVGKWDVGMATPAHTPKARGYDRSLSYFHHAIDYFDCGVPFSAIGEVNICLDKFTDLWLNDKPATGMCQGYVEDVFASYAVNQIRLASRSKQPLFLLYSSHLVHSPLQVPDDVLQMFDFIPYPPRKRLAAMAYYLDLTVGKIVTALKENHMWQNTLFLFFPDNGGAIYLGGAGNNYPLRAGKYADYEGGVRVNAFAAGGLVPVSRQGAVSERLIHISDIYATLIRLAKYGPNGKPNRAVLRALMFDPKAARAGLSQPDGVDTIWGAILDAPNEPQREEIWLSSKALLWGRYKLITGTNPQDIYTGPMYPNATGPQPNPLNTDFITNCGPRGCLYDVFSDPTEHLNIVSQNASLVNSMLARLAQLNQTLYSPNRGNETIKACLAAAVRYNGYYGPFLFPRPIG